jgi:hypothetical protein
LIYSAVTYAVTHIPKVAGVGLLILVLGIPVYLWSNFLGKRSGPNGPQGDSPEA